MYDETVIDDHFIEDTEHHQGEEGDKTEHDQGEEVDNTEHEVKVRKAHPQNFLVCSPSSNVTILTR